MRQNFSITSLILVLAVFSAKWDGKNKGGKAIRVEFKDDKSAIFSEEGKAAFPPEAKVTWQLVNVEQGHLDITIKMGDKSEVAKFLVKVEDDQMTLGAPKADERPANFEAADEAVVLTRAADDGLIGTWEGKSPKTGKTKTIEFKADKTFTYLQDGKADLPPGAILKYEIVEFDEGHVDFLVKVGEEEMRVPMLMVMNEGKLTIGGPKEPGKRAATLADSDDPVEFTRK
jgi:hypothetical protein